MRAPARLITLSLALLGAGAGAALATSESVSASSGNVSARLTYVHSPKSVVAPFSDLYLTIARAGKSIYGAPVSNTACGNECWPNVPDALRVLDVEADGEPDVLLNLYTSGAHCCNATDVFRYDAARNSYLGVLHVWGDPGYSLRRLDGSKPYEFVTADDRFAYEFAAYAYSGLPIEILRLRGDAFLDVTPSYPKLVAGDAAEQWRSYRENEGAGFGLGFLAAWAADEYSLGRRSAVAGTLARLERSGGLYNEPGAPWTGGAKFVTRLEQFLDKYGYS
ncbi:MAG: hypothetical protein ABSC56_14475 [Solirubrobacteraceae bacterium]|jgi:hypothetical protein